MDTIALPKKIEFTKGKDLNQKRVIIEACYPGYGTTIGNALRRILLSSLPGAAVIGVKIKGADHEFMALPHIKEDVLEIILNLKQLRLKMFTEEIVKLELVARGEKEVTAVNISKNSQVEIANPDLVLANITDMAGVLEMEIFVSSGKGYLATENRKNEKHEIGYIEVDSIFTPVLAVGINVENVRVGKMTNWDKLILDITTDGTITPEDAFTYATKILIKQFTSLIGGEQIVETEVKIDPIIEVEQTPIIEESTEEAVEEDGKLKKRGRPKKS
ncbi:MAG: DNA-directed RNA polymerase subunit alpha [Patescibacteria group bacterium]|nr:DNA-directed RNA polymerase subunit alpha [Patescibacteria group bacterium]MBU2081246.1 DNA-directed RNA polymerase subunit alpha [Patescibacteria group bacterium]MBU2214456.1 DNA-directed RNA polymerase subunit alpha [Patescibacteria group bacterium]MBU2250130.1 DNA-directed RNA polymerase subunit alpha [Patescibacteria group bacterium]